jgi:hypothetical protein
MLKQIAVVAVVLTCAAWCMGQEAVERPRKPKKPKSAAKPEPTPKANDLKTYELDIFGPTAEAAVKQAELHAVRSALGEIYCSDEMLMARALLDRYLANSYKRFITSEAVLSRRESQGMVYLRVSLVVDARALQDDLRQKRFFYKPRRRPIIYVTVAETIDSTPTAGEPISRTAIQDALAKLLMRFEPRVIYSQAANIDLTKDPQQMDAAREAAQRNGVEVILTGRVDLTLARERKIYFDDYSSFNAKATLSLIRVDDGLVLDSDAYEAGAGHRDKETAKREAASRATSKILDDRIPRFAERWERTTTDNAEFQVMLVGVNAEEAGVVENRLATRLSGTEVYRRSMFEDVVVYNLYRPPDKMAAGDRDQVVQVLRDLDVPRLTIMPSKTEKHVIAKRVP